MSKINELEAVIKEVHTGEWSAQAGYMEDGGKAAFAREHRLNDEDEGVDGHPEDEEEHRAEKDAAFITLASPTTVQALIDALKAQANVIAWHSSGRMDDPEGVLGKLTAALDRLDGS